MHSIRRMTLASVVAIMLVATLAGTTSAAGRHAKTYRVTIVNLTSGQAFTPPLIAAHRPSLDIYSVGSKASFGVKEIAENGNLMPLLDSLGAKRGVKVKAAAEPLVPVGSPGQEDLGFTNTVTMKITAGRRVTKLTWVSMLICTNDGFTGVDSIRLPRHVGGTTARFTRAYDAGTEKNTELFDDIVPPCQGLIGGPGSGGSGMSDPSLAQHRVIHRHRGIVGDADLDTATYGWRNPVAAIVVQRIR